LGWRSICNLQSAVYNFGIDWPTAVQFATEQHDSFDGPLQWCRQWQRSDHIAKPLLLIPIGLAYAAVYYFLFRFVIRKWNLRTPGREEEDGTESATDGALLTQDTKA
jgi:hypothetical protein